MLSKKISCTAVYFGKKQKPRRLLAPHTPAGDPGPISATPVPGIRLLFPALIRMQFSFLSCVFYPGFGFYQTFPFLTAEYNSHFEDMFVRIFMTL